LVAEHEIECVLELGELVIMPKSGKSSMSRCAYLFDILRSFLKTGVMPCGPLNFFEEQAGMLWGALTAGMAKSVVVSFGSPYLGHEYFETAPAYLNAHFPDPATQEAVVQALLGEIPFCGVSPVRL
jgi:hypothetical protein